MDSKDVDKLIDAAALLVEAFGMHEQNMLHISHKFTKHSHLDMFPRYYNDNEFNRVSEKLRALKGDGK